MADRAVVDSNVLVALVDSRDKWHGEAKVLLAELKARGIGPVHFDCVLNETISVLARRAEEQKRSEQLPALLEDLLQKVPRESLTWISGETQRLYEDIVALVKESLGSLNFHDALMALWCRESGIGYMASFDEGFDGISWLTRLGSPIPR
jgi:predicted nucleic acid-binding protein